MREYMHTYIHVCMHTYACVCIESNCLAPPANEGGGGDPDRKHAYNTGNWARESSHVLVQSLAKLWHVDKQHRKS